MTGYENKQRSNKGIKQSFKIGERFTNPYNFVPLLEQCMRSERTLTEEDMYTGFFDCTLELLTPMFIPNISCKGDKELEYDFYSYDDLRYIAREKTGHRSPPSNPVIPGSAIRGPVRSVHEAAFNGCMSTVDIKRIFERRCAEAKKAGLLVKEENKWKLYPCERAMLNVERNNGKDDSFKDTSRFGVYVPRTVYDKWDEGDKIRIRLSKGGYKKGSRNGEIKVELVQDIQGLLQSFSSEKKEGSAEEWKDAWVHKGEPFGNKKHHESVFYKIDDDKTKALSVSDKEVENLIKSLEDYQNPKKNTALKQAQLKHEKDQWYPEYSIDKGNLHLVYYYEQDGKVVYLSPACIGKEIFHKNLKEILANNGGYYPCEKKEYLCPTCKLFGMVEEGEESRGAVGSRVRFTDALLVRPENPVNATDLFMDPVMLPEMGEPRPGAVEFYTIPPYSKLKGNWNGMGEGYWTYDYMIKKGQRSNRERIPLHNSLPMIRGRKFYWHRDEIVHSNGVKNNMNQGVRPLRKSNMEEGIGLFEFRVYFENLTKEELLQLRWSLDFQDSSCAHKLGRGKPLGYGSTRIHINELSIRKIVPETGEWDIKKIKDLGFLGEIDSEADEAIKILKLMANWEKRPPNVSYPKGKGRANPKSKKKNEDASHQWFKNNRTILKGTNSMEPVFAKVLPKPEEECQKPENFAKVLHKLDAE